MNKATAKYRTRIILYLVDILPGPISPDFHIDAYAQLAAIIAAHNNIIDNMIT